MQYYNYFFSLSFQHFYSCYQQRLRSHLKFENKNLNRIPLLFSDSVYPKNFNKIFLARALLCVILLFSFYFFFFYFICIILYCICIFLLISKELQLLYFITYKTFSGNIESTKLPYLPKQNNI